MEKGKADIINCRTEDNEFDVGYIFTAMPQSQGYENYNSRAKLYYHETVHQRLPVRVMFHQ